jgi:hypothetical protein
MTKEDLLINPPSSRIVLPVIRVCSTLSGHSVTILRNSFKYAFFMKVTSDGRERLGDRSAWKQYCTAYNQSVQRLTGSMCYYNLTHQHYDFIVQREKTMDYDYVFMSSNYVYMLSRFTPQYISRTEHLMAAVCSKLCLPEG